MKYSLVNTELVIAEEDMRCDGMSAYFFKIDDCATERKEFSLIKKNDILVIFKHRGHIKKGDCYLERQFVDQHGEVFYLNTIPEMDTVAIRNELYPQLIISQIKNAK